MRIISSIVLVTAFALVFNSSNSFGAAGASFRRLGSRMGFIGSSALAVSGDGSTIVGYSGGHPVRWVESGGASSLTPGPTTGAYAMDVSFDGSVIVVSGSSGVFYWTEPNGLTAIEAAPGEFDPVEVRGLSSDGMVAVGRNGLLQAYRWTLSTGAVGIGHLPGGEPFSSAEATSADGSVIVGRGYSGEGGAPIRWTAETGITALRTLEGESLPGHAYDVSDDGRVIVGFFTTPAGDPLAQNPYRWTEDGGLVGLGPLPTGGSRGFAKAVSSHGSVIVGSYELRTGFEAFVWDAHHGMRDLRVLLTSQYGINLDGWKLGFSSDVSADGRIIVGTGTNPDGFQEGWQIVLPIPEPTSMVSLSCLVICCLLRLRNRSGVTAGLPSSAV